MAARGVRQPLAEVVEQALHRAERPDGLDTAELLARAKLHSARRPPNAPDRDQHLGRRRRAAAPADDGRDGPGHDRLDSSERTRAVCVVRDVPALALLDALEPVQRRARAL